MDEAELTEHLDEIEHAVSQCRKLIKANAPRITVNKYADLIERRAHLIAEATQDDPGKRVVAWRQ